MHLCSETSNRRFSTRQFVIERSYWSKKTGRPDNFAYTLPAAQMPLLMQSLQESQEVKVN